MARNILVINCDIRETRVALIEDGVIAELEIERASTRGALGNIVLGKVTRVLPGMQAAFIDVGLERAAFLHVEDLIRPDDFEAYLASGREEALPTKRGEGERRTTWAESSDDEAPEVEAPEDAEDNVDDLEDDVEDGAPGETEDSTEDGADVDEAADTIKLKTDEADHAAADDSAVGDAEDDEQEPETNLVRQKRRKRGSQPSEARDAEEAEPESDSRSNRRRRKRRNGENKAAKPERSKGKKKTTPSRVQRSVPITEVVKEGDEVIVQISKEPIGTKGARVTSHVSLPGRYVVYLPTVDHAGISKRIGSNRERARLKEVIEALKPETGGLIVRTVAEGLTKKALKADVGYLIKLWAEVARRREGARAPSVLYTELDLVLRTARDLFTDQIEKIVIDDREQYARLVRFVGMFLPERVKDIELYSDEEPVFDAYGIEDEIGRALSRKVPLPSGGYLVIDQAEALAAIDVNTGRYIGKGSKDLEETALKTNLEAVDEIAYQLRFRNIGGLVILDLIDMDLPTNRDKVWRALEHRLAKDKAKTTLNRISDLGLIEMTRKRTRESLSRAMHEPCFYCDGTGQIQSRTTIAYEILRQIRRERESLQGYRVIVNAHPAVVDLLNTEEKNALADAERRYMRQIALVACRDYHIEQFDLQGG